MAAPKTLQNNRKPDPPSKRAIRLFIDSVG
jgi:hypothetical protein